MFRWLAGRGASRREVARMRARLDDDLWHQTLADYSFLVGLSCAENDALRDRTAWVLASKSFVGVQGLVITDAIMLAIAVQAALPILNLDVALYEGWTEIIVYPGGFLVPCTEVDEAGVVHEYVQEVSGEAWEGGPVILSWEDISPAIVGSANVVIHEFAHKLDLHAGDADGVPVLSNHAQINPAHWRRVLDSSFTQFRDMLGRTEAAVPSNVDLESGRVALWFDTLPLDPYAASDIAEFFAVSTETFFVKPAPLAAAFPEWYALLAQYYRQNTLQRFECAGMP